MQLKIQCFRLCACERIMAPAAEHDAFDDALPLRMWAVLFDLTFASNLSVSIYEYINHFLTPIVQEKPEPLD